jgi:ribosomal protein L11 methyltransferase
VNWLEVSVSAGAEDVDAATAALERLGALAVTTRPQASDPVLEPEPGHQPPGRRNRVTGLFEATADPARIRAGLAKLQWAGARDPVLETLEDADWQHAWREEARPRAFGNGLWVVPADAPAPPDARAVVRLDPGLAFGTGSHCTTALCLRWLASLDLRGRTVIDFGCGSGILAVAAATLGADHVQAWDHDPQALAATRDNAAANGVADRVLVTGEPVPAHVLVANILADALQDLAPRFAQLVRPQGLVGLSGILEHQVTGLVECYAPTFQMRAPISSDGWALLTGRRLGGGQVHARERPGSGPCT